MNRPPGGPYSIILLRTSSTSHPLSAENVSVFSLLPYLLSSCSLSFVSSQYLKPKMWAERIEKAKAGIDDDVVKLKLRIKACEEETEIDCEQRAAAEILRVGLLEKLDLNRHTIEKREVDVAAVKKNLEIAKALHHDLITRKVRALAACGCSFDSLYLMVLYVSMAMSSHRVDLALVVDLKSSHS